MRKYLNDDSSSLAGQKSAGIAAPQRSLGLYRTLIAIASCTATVLIVLWVGMTSGSYNSTVDGAHKAIVVVVDGLHPDMVEFATTSNKAPFISELVRTGSVMGSLAVPADVRDAITAQQTILTGLTPSQTGIYSSNDFNKAMNTNFSSFLKIGRSSELRTTVIAPTTKFSGSQFVDGKCANLGVLDAECVGLACPTGNDTESFCNAAWRFKTAEDSDENTRNEDYIYSKVAAAASAKMDLIYLDLSNFAAVGKDTSVNNLAAISEMYVTDALIGRIASLLASRSGTKGENWLIVLTSDGQNTQRKAPYFIANLREGAPAVVTQPTETASLLDIFPTIVEWMGLIPRSPASYTGKILGVCSKNNVSIVEGC